MADYRNVSFKHNGRLKLLIVVGTRPEIIRLSAVINKTRKYFDVILAGIDGDPLLQAVDVAVEMNGNGDLGLPVPDYVEENVSDKVVKIIQSYTGVVNKLVWRKD